MLAAIKLCVIANDKKVRLDKFISRELGDFSRSKIQKLVISSCISVNGVVIVDPNHSLKFKDEIVVCDNFIDEKSALLPEKDVKFSVIYEDEDLILINKPAGVVVHPGAGNHRHTLANGLAYYYNDQLSSQNGDHRPGIVHRIDKNTSGIIVVAKNDHAHAALSEQFRVHSIRRKYICFCYSIPRPINGKIDTLIARDRNNRLKMAVTSHGGKRAISVYRTMKSFSKFASKIECELYTGRTHQIRVHMSHIGTSLIGDSTYRAKNYCIHKSIEEYIKNFPRQALHAYYLEFTHPRSGKSMLFNVGLPSDMLELENMLEEMVV
jgi:23S rRNA pseudouridine1911/1915/1917 synthase